MSAKSSATMSHDVLDGQRGGLGTAAMHGRQLEHLGARKDAGRVAEQRPDHVGHAVADLARRAPAAGRRAPWTERSRSRCGRPRPASTRSAQGSRKARLGRRLRAEEVVDRQRHLLRRRRGRDERAQGGCAQQARSVLAIVLSPDLSLFSGRPSGRGTCRACADNGKERSRPANHGFAGCHNSSVIKRQPAGPPRGRWRGWW